MTRATVASFNVKNLIGADQEYYQFQSYTPEEYAWKRDWLADQMVTLDADVIGFQEVFDEAALSDVITLADAHGAEQNDFSLPDAAKRYRKRAIFDKLAYGSYREAEIAFAPTLGDVGTTLSHPPSSSHRGLTVEGRAKLGITEGFFRVSVGVEEEGILVSEMLRAADAARGQSAT